MRYYVDSLRVFRFVQGRDSFWRKHVLQTDEADPQWRQVMRSLGVDVSYALSPQAKGKIEKPYRWLQDRIVRTCAIERLTAIDDVRIVLKEELNRYNNHQVHSTTGEKFPASALTRLEKRERACLDLLPYPVRIPRLKTSSAYERHEWSTATARYLYSTMRYQCHMYRCERRLRFI